MLEHGGTTVVVNGNGFRTVDVIYCIFDSKQEKAKIISDVALTCKTSSTISSTVEFNITSSKFKYPFLVGNFYFTMATSIISIFPTLGSFRGGTPVTVKVIITYFICKYICI